MTRKAHRKWEERFLIQRTKDMGNKAYVNNAQDHLGKVPQGH